MVILSGSESCGWFLGLQWFKGGKTNICYNAVDRNVEAGNGDKIAMYWEGNEPGQDGKLTYSELLDRVCQVNAHSYLRTYWTIGV